MWCPAYVESEQALLNTTEVTQQQCSVSFGWQPTNDLTSPPGDLWGRGRDAEWALGVAAEGGGCRDERRGRSASEVGTDDGTAKKKKKNKKKLGLRLSTWSLDVINMTGKCEQYDR